jgi:predicted alpha/beta hydrolase family esterase
MPTSEISAEPDISRVIVVPGFRAGPESHWFPWLLDELAVHNIDATVVALPNPDAPDEQLWAQAIADHVGEVDKTTWLVGHSLGCISVLRHLLQRADRWELGGLVLVAGFTGTLPVLPELDDILAMDPPVESLAAHVGTIALIGSDNDPVVPTDATNALAQRLNARVDVVSGAGHFLDTDGVRELSIVLDKIVGVAARPGGPSGSSV